jgi:hypothetical protein
MCCSKLDAPLIVFFLLTVVRDKQHLAELGHRPSCLTHIDLSFVSKQYMAASGSQQLQAAVMHSESLTKRCLHISQLPI